MKSYSISQHRLNSLLYSITLHCLVPFFLSGFAHLDCHLNSILFISPHITGLPSISLHCCWNNISYFSRNFYVFYITSPKVKSYSNFSAEIGHPFISPHCCCNRISIISPKINTLPFHSTWSKHNPYHITVVEIVIRITSLMLY